MNPVSVVLIVVAAIVLLLLLWAVTQYNRLVRLRNLVQEAWRQIDVELHRRHDLIPNLVETVKGYAAHERAVFDEVARARAAASGTAAGPAQQAQQENALTAALGRLFAVAENYPQLKADETFKQLQNRITALEESIADRREFYNDQVNLNNIRVKVFPDVMIAQRFGFQPAQLLNFTADEKRDVDMDALFSGT